MVIKVCTVCGDEFDARGKAKCCSAACSQIAEAERGRAYSEAYREANREKIAEKNRAYHKAYYEANRAYREANPDKEAERKRAISRNKNLRITQITAQFKEV